MLIINKGHGHFGNQILHINNLIQISHRFKQNYLIDKFDNSDLFTLNVSPVGGIPIDRVLSPEILLFEENLSLDSNKNYLIDFSLFELFFKYDDLSTFDIFKFKEPLTEEKSKQVGIHFRGTDFKNWDSNSVLNSSYYINSIECIEAEEKNLIDYTLYTDDKTLDCYNETIKYLNDKNIPIKFGSTPQNDFRGIANSDYVISTPSTFAITACFCGKRDKKIIHNDGWLTYKSTSENIRDIFWKKLLSGGNNDYKIWKIIK